MNNYYGIKVDVKHITEGLVEMIKTHPHGDCFRLGMFPADLMEILEKQLAEKIPDSFYSETTGEVHDNGAEIRREIVRDICIQALHDPMVIV